MMNIQRYLATVSPFGILQVIKDEVLQSLLDGYSFALGSGISIVFPGGLPVAESNLDRRTALRGLEKRANNQLCAHWRDDRCLGSGCGRNEDCEQADNRVAIRFLKEEWTRPTIYRCESLRLWDMAFPLRIENRVIGVLFGGQIVVRGKDVINWQEVFQGLGDLVVDWSNVPKTDSHVAAVHAWIQASTLLPEEKARMLRLLANLPNAAPHYVTTEGLRERIQTFLGFGKMTQDLLGELYGARKATAEHQLLGECIQSVDAVDLADEDKWYDGCRGVVSQLRGLPEVTDARLYVRRQSRYERKIPVAASDDLASRLATRDVIQAFAAGQLVDISSQSGDVLKTLDLASGPIWGYRSQTGVGDEVSSTLLILQGAIPAHQGPLLSSLCGAICSAADVASLIYREREADDRYRQRIRLIGHSFRTPLQSLQFGLEEIGQDEAVSRSTELKNKVAEGLTRIKDAKEDLFNLLEPADQVEEEFDLLAILGHVIRVLEPIAKKHPCSIVRRGEWSRVAKVKGNRYRIQRAIICLLENAIKYSFFVPKDAGLFQVEVRFKILESRHATISIKNYGIGIPKDKLEIIHRYGARSNVDDKKKLREGTGLGLPFAIEVFGQSGGWVHVVSSEPAGSATPADVAQHLRFVTVVEAALPVLDR